MLLDVVEAESEDLDEDIKEDLGPIGFLIFVFLFLSPKGTINFIFHDR